MIRRPNTNKVTKATTLRRPPNRRIDEDQLAAHFEGNEEEHALYRAAAAVASGDSHGEVEEAVMDDGADVSFKNEPIQDDGDAEGDIEAEHEPDHEHHHPHQHHHGQLGQHGHDGRVDDVMDHGMPMAPMSAEPHHHHHHHHQPHAHPHHSQHQQAIDDILGTGSMSYAQAAAAATAADLQPPPPPQPNVGPTISAPQPLVAATDFQPTPSTSSHSAQQQVPPQLQQQQQQQQQHAPPPAPLPSQQQQQQQQPQPKTTEQMAQESGYAGFKVDSAFAKRMARDPGQRLAEQRRHGQDLNLVRRSNVEALFAQIAGTEAQHPCAHCRKGQGPWTVCVVYSGQMMGSCANCWFNASGSRCSFHEKSQPVQPAQHPYAAVPVPVPVAGDQQQGGAGAFVGGSPAQLQAAQFWQMPAVTFSSDAGVKQTVLNALTTVRAADRYQRALIEVDVAAKQLALKIVHAEELAAGAGGGGGGGVGIGGVGDGGGVDEDEHGRQDSHYESPAPGGDMPEDGDS
ncbi:hypothetical protein VM1G_00877 [Cytospora mali]|uniref:Uncharacterized protein n=1 Tax=Cytospora mali TaxID=578113 RepID=A0A194VKJ7_CYTMA|nr:hypothetical protein VM1G_00877 [Valsa mali]